MGTAFFIVSPGPPAEPRMFREIRPPVALSATARCPHRARKIASVPPHSPARPLPLDPPFVPGSDPAPRPGAAAASTEPPHCDLPDPALETFHAPPAAWICGGNGIARRSPAGRDPRNQA